MLIKSPLSVNNIPLSLEKLLGEFVAAIALSRRYFVKIDGVLSIRLREWLFIDSHDGVLMSIQEPRV